MCLKNQFGFSVPKILISLFNNISPKFQVLKNCFKLEKHYFSGNLNNFSPKAWHYMVDSILESWLLHSRVVMTVVGLVVMFLI